MPRLITLNQPRLASIDWLSGPNARNSGSTTASDGSEQTFDSVGDVVALRLNFAIAKGMRARRQRGLVTALPNGNAFRLKYIDPDRMKPSEAGLVGSYGPVPWDNGQPWGNGQYWAPSLPIVPVAAAAAYDSGIVTLADQHWGHRLGVGDQFGFKPFHFGVYTVTEMLDDGVCRVWPRLRKALTTSVRATLDPTIVMRPTGKDVATWSRGASHQDGISINCVEVVDPYVRQYFTE